MLISGVQIAVTSAPVSSLNVIHLLMSVNQAASWEDGVAISRNACQDQMFQEKGRIRFSQNTVCYSGPSFGTCGRLRPLRGTCRGCAAFSAACALLGSWFLLAFPCAGIETAVPAVLLVASMIMSPPAAAVGVDCLETGVSVPLSMFWCSCTASR